MVIYNVTFVYMFKLPCSPKIYDISKTLKPSFIELQSQIKLLSCNIRGDMEYFLIGPHYIWEFSKFILFWWPLLITQLRRTSSDVTRQSFPIICQMILWQTFSSGYIFLCVFYELSVNPNWMFVYHLRYLHTMFFSFIF